MSTNKKPIKAVHQQSRILLGTSLVPMERMRQEQLDKSAQALSNYRAKKEALIKRIKNEGLTSELLELKTNLKMTPVELRIKFIPFELVKKESGESNEKRYHRSLLKHIEIVNDEHEVIVRNYLKKNPELKSNAPEGFKSNEVKLLEKVESFKKTSKITSYKRVK